MPGPSISEADRLARMHEAAARRAQDETALRESNDLLRLAEQTARVGHWHIGASGRSTWSDGMFRLYSLAPDAPVPCSAEILSLYHPDDRDRARAVIRAAKAAGGPFEFEARIPTAEGRPRILLVRGICELDPQGVVRASFGVVMDVTAIKGTEEELRRTTALLGATLDTMDQGLMMIDAGGVVRICNERAIALLDLPRDMMRADPTLAEVRAYQSARGEFARSEGEERRMLEQSRFGAGPLHYERERPDGTVLEIRTVMLPDGSAVRTYTDITARKRTERALREKTALLDATLENMDQGLMMVDAGGTVRVCNGRAIGLLDLPAEMMRAEPSFAAVRNHQLARDEFARSPETMARWVAASGLERTAHAYERERPDGTVLEVRTVPLADGSAVRTYTDITDRKRAEARLAESEERLGLALDSGSDGLWDWDFPSGRIWLSDPWWRMLGYARGEIEPHIREWLRLVHPDDEKPARARLRRHCEGQLPVYECEYRLRTRDGSWAWVLARGKVVSRGPDGAPLRIVGTHIDINARKAAEGRIAHMARHDALTDLPNRALFRERLDQCMAALGRRGGACAVLCLDLDRFKAVNDTLGHLAGDALLREVAHRIRSALRAEDTVARLGGDEFAILLDRPGGPDRLAALAERLVALVRRPVAYGDQEVAVGLSVGIALAPEHGSDGEGLFKRADLALYRAKAEGRNTWRFFEPAMDEAVAERRRLELDLVQAIAHSALTLHYQPQVRAATGEVVGFEALVRWQHPTRGAVPPSVFVPLAEETGLIGAIGEWVLRAACAEAARWPRPLKVAVNLSPRQFQQGDLPALVTEVLAETGLSPSRLELEVTETVIINDLERALGMLRRLKGLGIAIAMDDFGTGYSSLATLQAFPFDKIKIDRSFVGEMGRCPQAAAIVRAVLGLGRSLGMAVVAEGVETPAQLRFLMDEACEEVQGYLTGRPQPIASFAELLAAPRRAA